MKGLKIAQRRLRPEVRAKLLSVASARANHDLVPEAWRFIFLDPATSGHCRVVTVAAKTSSEHPDTVEAFSGASRQDNVSTAPVIPQGKLLIDSDKALALVRAQSKLKGIRTVEFRLIQQKGSQEPYWSIQFFAENDNMLVQFRVGAKTGTVESGAEKEFRGA